MRDDKERVLDIADSIARIKKYAELGKASFEGDELIQNWIVHHLQILGEAAARLSSEFKAAHAEIPWEKIVGMRNILVHDYFEVDTAIVWSVVEKDLPEIEKNIREWI